MLPLLLVIAAAPPSGYEVAKKAYDSIVAGFGGERIDSTMVLFDGAGNKVVSYKLNTLLLEANEGNGRVAKTLIRFLDPPDTKGTALLTHEKKSGEESRWLFLSETRQVKQIGGASKSSSFKGSELSYEDLAIDTLDKYEYQLLGEKTVEGRPAFQVEAKPKFTDSGYSKLVTYYDKEHYYVVRTEFFDKAGQLLKVGVYKKMEKVDGRWRAHYSEINNLQTKKKTAVLTHNVKLNLKLSDALFTSAQLQKS